MKISNLYLTTTGEGGSYFVRGAAEDGSAWAIHITGTGKIWSVNVESHIEPLGINEHGWVTRQLYASPSNSRVGNE